MRYTETALNTLKEARIANPNVSQRKMARNIFNLDEPGWKGTSDSAPVDTNTPTLSATLGHPSDSAIQHLIRNIDKQISVEKAAVAASAKVQPGKAGSGRAGSRRGRRV